jgi:MFS family permease
MDRPVSALAVWALGVTQIVGYGTLYYAFTILTPAIGLSYGWNRDLAFAALSAALLVSGFFAPFAGRLLDRFGAARVMALGSVLAAATLAGCAIAADGTVFVIVLVAMQMASTTILYAAAFAALVELGGRGAQKSITHLTLIAGFASTVFWPFTGVLAESFSWQQIFLVFAALHIVMCVPLHLWLAAHSKHRRVAHGTDGGSRHAEIRPALPSELQRYASALLLFGFAIEGFILSGVLLHVVPMLEALGLAAVSLLVTSLFGPSQVLSRVVNMLFGKGLRQTHLAIIAAGLLPSGLVALAATAPSPLGAVVFAILFGLGSGLTSIVAGSLPLELFGTRRYGTRLGSLSSARQIAAALAPFAVASLVTLAGTTVATWIVAGLGCLGVGSFWLVGVIADRARAATAGV